jgi:hypothetical protein
MTILDVQQDLLSVMYVSKGGERVSGWLWQPMKQCACRFSAPVVSAKSAHFRILGVLGSRCGVGEGNLH